MATTMSFARAFSTRRDTQKIEPICVGRAATQRGGRPVVRAQISSPMALVSTSNVHIYSAQTIAGTIPIEIRSVSQSSNDSSSSDESDVSFKSMQSAGTITDASSVDNSPLSSSPEPNILTSHVKPTFTKSARLRSDTLTSTASTESAESTDPDATPTIPRRAPSHSKKAHQQLHHKLSVQNMLQPSRAAVDVPRSSFDIVADRSSAKPAPITALLPPLDFGNDSCTTAFDFCDGLRPKTAPGKPQYTEKSLSPVSPVSPFDQELAQLQEVAEGFGRAVWTAEEDEDVMHMESRGLASFSAIDYMSEIQGLIHAMFAEEQPFFRHLGGFF